MKAENKVEQRQLITQIGDLFDKHTQCVAEDCSCGICKKVEALGRRLAELEEYSSDAVRLKAREYTRDEFIEMSQTMTDEAIAAEWGISISQLAEFKRVHNLKSVSKYISVEVRNQMKQEATVRKAKGDLVRDIAAEYGVSANYLSKLMAQGA
ncbi:hypothetical protein [Listeria booriae]|uniref:hypothetical protein n=1 Tax=Listeria booriae TaxID=1552123 RepID=UPI001629C706|nr:hypothetical protein [Listeria booriae]MBC2188685.1 hypothetical protein [Listeria booriae]